MHLGCQKMEERSCPGPGDVFWFRGTKFSPELACNCNVAAHISYHEPRKDDR